MKKVLFSLAFCLLFIWSGYNSYKLSKLEPTETKIVTNTVIKEGQDGYTPIKGKDYEDGKTLPALIPKSGVDGLSGSNGSNAKPCTTYNDDNGNMVQECPDGSTSIIKKPIDGSDGFTPTLICNVITGKFQVLYNPEFSYQDIPNSRCVV